MLDVIRETVARISNEILFEINGKELRNKVKTMLEEELRRAAPVGYELINVKCDEENNPPELIDKGMIKARIYFSEQEDDFCCDVIIDPAKTKKDLWNELMHKVDEKFSEEAGTLLSDNIMSADPKMKPITDFIFNTIVNAPIMPDIKPFDEKELYENQECAGLKTYVLVMDYAIGEAFQYEFDGNLPDEEIEDRISENHSLDNCHYMSKGTPIIIN